MIFFLLICIDIFKVRHTVSKGKNKKPNSYVFIYFFFFNFYISVLLSVRNFRGLSAGIADGPLDVIFSVREVVCSSKGYMSRFCCPVPARHAQALKKKSITMIKM